MSDHIVDINKMVFSDDNLKRLKEQIEGLPAARPSWQMEAFDICRKLPALLARLEVAEKVCEYAGKVVRPRERLLRENAPRELDLRIAFDEWREVARK